MKTQWMCWPFCQRITSGNMETVLVFGLHVWMRVGNRAKWVFGRVYRVA